MKKIWEVQRLFRQRESNDKVDKWLDSQKKYSEKNMSLNFAITLTIAITSVLYKSYIYFQNNAVNEYQFMAFSLLLSLSITILSLLLIFILLRGLSIELDESTLKSNIILLSSKFYKIAFVTFIIWTVVLLSILLINYPSDNPKSINEFAYVILILGVIFIYVSCKKLHYNFDFHLTLKHEIGYFFLIASLLLFISVYIIPINIGEGITLLAIIPVMDMLKSIIKKNASPKSKVSKEITRIGNFLSIFYLSLFVLIIFMVIIGTVFTFQSHINLEMSDTYDRNESVIHASLKLTGYNEKINLTVSKIDFTNEINEVESLVLEPTSDSSYKGDILFWTYLGNGEYSIYLNMTTQPSGYYKLSTETNYIKTTAKVFYLE